MDQATGVVASHVEVAAGRINRREALRRVAIVGGTVVWAAPTVQRLGIRAAHAVSPPPSPPPTSPPPPPPPSKFAGISYVGLVFSCNGTQYRAKWEEDDAWGDSAGGRLPQCPEPAGWSTSPVFPDPGSHIQVGTNYVGGELYQVTFTLPAGCSFASGSGTAKGGNPTKPQTGGYCVPGVVRSDSRSITFTAPPAP